MSTARKLRRNQTKGMSNLDKAMAAVQQIQKAQGSLEGVPSLVASLESLRGDLEAMVQHNEELSIQVAALRETFVGVLPYLNLPVDLQARIEIVLKVE
jgi:hypothetical protein